MKKIIVAFAVLLSLFLPATSSAGNLIVLVKDVETKNPIKGAIVSIVLFDEKEESWKQDWWGSFTKDNGITLHLNLEMWQKCVVRVEAKGYFTTFYGTPFYFYGVPEIVTVKQPNTRLEIFLQPETSAPRLDGSRIVKK